MPGYSVSVIHFLNNIVETSLSRKLLAHVSRWARIKEIPHKTLYEYVPVAQAPSDERAMAERKLIWSFKSLFPQEKNIQEEINERVEYSEIIIAELEELISETFREDTPYLTFMPLPCSTPARYEHRYKALATKICEDLHMANGYAAITVCEPSEESQSNRYFIDDSMIKGKRVLLFDDIVTTGDAAVRMKTDLEERGSEVIAFVTISKTRIEEV